MRTTKKEFKEQVRAHIIECLSTDETEVLKDQLQNTVDAFRNWYGAYEQKRNPNKYNAFKDWLLGLPSELNAEYTNHQINLTLASWFENCGEDYKEQDSDKEAALYYHLVTREFEALCKQEGVTF